MPGTSGMGTELRGASGRKGITCGVAVAFCARTRPKYPAAATTMATAVVIRKIHNSLADGAFINFSPSAHRTKIDNACLSIPEALCFTWLVFLYCTQVANCSPSAGSVFISQVFHGATAKRPHDCHRRVVCAYCSGIFFPLSLWAMSFVLMRRKKRIRNKRFASNPHGGKKYLTFIRRIDVSDCGFRHSLLERQSLHL